MNVDDENFLAAMHYVSGIREATTVAEAFDAFQRLITELNFIGYGYASDINFGQIGGEAGIMSNTLPAAWQAEYFQKGYIHSDPVLEWCMALSPPATWSIIKTGLGKEQHPIWQEAKEYGLIDGVAFPFFLTDKIGLISMASHVPIQRHVFVIAKYCARYLVAAIHFLHRGQPIPRGVGDDRFTDQDFKLLYLYKSGFTDQEISETMKVDRSTITRHMHRLKDLTFTHRRLGPAIVMDWCGII